MAAAIGEVIYGLLYADANILGITEGRIYPAFIPQLGKLPAIVYNQIGAPRGHTMDGPSGLVDGHWQITCWDKDYAHTQELSDLVRLALDGYAKTWNGRLISVMMLENEVDLISLEVEDVTRFGKALDFQILFKE